MKHGLGSQAIYPGNLHYLSEINGFTTNARQNSALSLKTPPGLPFSPFSCCCIPQQAASQLRSSPSGLSSLYHSGAMTEYGHGSNCRKLLSNVLEWVAKKMKAAIWPGSPPHS